MLQWIILLVIAAGAGKALSYSATLQEAGALMAEKHGLGVQPIQYQNTLTPPWLTNFTIAVWVALFADAAWVWYLNGWQQGVGALVAAIILPAMFQAVLPPRRGSGMFLRNAFHAMVNLQADYERDGDQARAQAMAINVELLLATRPDLLDAFKQKGSRHAG
ncbi:hypothetical protein [Rhizobium sp. 007]|uniref:hypothetical protein n=1 Tax=Rhizobium sp. 007 TaxID=2785056 RepID=UPI00188F486D|nr:hypothetical protein [Rhizobium sp. 007]QPB20378.1 hypothetical protein ISN39_02340 [Rhizobium sp. 007]